MLVGTQRWKQLTIQTLLQLYPRKKCELEPNIYPQS